MILTCNYEELTALGHGVRAILDEGPFSAQPAIDVSTDARDAVAFLAERLDASVAIATLHEQRAVEQALGVIVEHLRAEVDDRVLLAHPAAEESVEAYFDFAHALSVLGKAREIGREMTAVIEIVSGSPPDERAVKSFVFPD